MAIKTNFGGSTIYHPGAYSKSITNPTPGSNVVSTDTLFLIGEASGGQPGSSAGIVFYPASAASQIQSIYQSGPIVDAIMNCLAPLKLSGGGGPGLIGIYKTNASVQASLSLASSYATLKALDYGVNGNRITAKIIVSAEVSPAVTGSAAVTNFGGLNTETLVIRTNGAASVTVTFSSPASIADVISQINSQDTQVTASQVGGILTITKNTSANHNRDGFGSTIEIVSGSALGLLFLTAGQFGVAASEQTATVTLASSAINVTETDVEGGAIALSIGRTNASSCTAATVQVSSTSLVLTATGSTSYNFTLSQYPLIKDLVAAINNVAGGWSVTANATLQSLPSSALDEMTIGAFSEAGNQPARIKIDAYSMSHAFDSSQLVSIAMTAVAGLPDQLSPAASLAGGLLGASASSDFENALTLSLSEDVNVIVPLISQDASADISMGVTDSSSTYDVEAVQAALSSNLALRGNIKNRREAQGVVGYRVNTAAAMYAQAALLADSNTQLVGQDVLVVDSTGNLNYKQPHILAAMIAGARLGVDIGEPLTYKFIAVSAVGHFVNPSTGVSGGDFNPVIDGDAAIQAGVTYLEPAQGAFRIAVDNTTYGADANFVYNRGSVVQAAQYIAKTIRNDAELTFVGKKTSIVDANAIKSRISTILRQLLVAQIIVPSTGYPLGYNTDTFTVQVVGNTASVQLEVFPVLGLDFVLITFTLSEATSNA
jgi:hypothetical protein